MAQVALVSMVFCALGSGDACMYIVDLCQRLFWKWQAFTMHNPVALIDVFCINYTD